MPGLRLNLGCGDRKTDGYVNIDKFDNFAPDLVLDLEALPWPFETDAVAEIQAVHVLEHLGQDIDGFLGIIREMYRVCCDNAAVLITVPHHRSESFAGDPTHVRAIAAKGIALFSKDYCRAFREHGWSNTRLAQYLDVDSGIARVVCDLTPGWRQRLQSGSMTPQELNDAIVTCNNVVEQVIFELRAVKSPATQAALGHTDGNISFFWT